MQQGILFIGGAGFIGSSIIRELIKQECCINIHVLEPIQASIKRIAGFDINFIRGDLSNIELIENIVETHQITKIIHLVSTMVPGCNYEDYVEEFSKVIFPTVRLMQLCSRNNIQFIYFSSGGTVYGERKTLVPFVESDPKEPISYYGLSKQMIENSIQFEHRVSGLQYLVLRPSNPYGPGQNIHGRQGLIAVALGKVFEDEPITIWGDGSSVRDYIYIEDLAQLVVEILLKGVINQTINIGSGKGYSVKQIIDVLQNVVDEDVKVEYTASRKNDVSNMILDNSIMKGLVSMDLTSIEDGIKKFYEYEKQEK